MLRKLRELALAYLYSGKHQAMRDEEEADPENVRKFESELRAVSDEYERNGGHGYYESDRGSLSECYLCGIRIHMEDARKYNKAKRERRPDTL